MCGPVEHILLQLYDLKRYISRSYHSQQLLAFHVPILILCTILIAFQVTTVCTAIILGENVSGFWGHHMWNLTRLFLDGCLLYLLVSSSDTCGLYMSTLFVYYFFNLLKSSICTNHIVLIL